MSNLLNRVIPCLLLQDGGLVKTQRFAEPRYVGDPINAIRIFNQKYVDELLLIDIDASRLGHEPNYDLIAHIAEECFIPLTYGGGIRTLAQARRIVSSGVEKISVNSLAIEDPAMVSVFSQEFGASSVVAAIDIKRDLFGRYRVYHPGRRASTGIDPVAHVKALVRAGVGELFLNDVDRDGTGKGYDLGLISLISKAVDVPVIACGGAAGLDDVRAAIRSGASAAAAGSLFVFVGPHRAVLINYPSYADMRELFAK